MHRYQRSDFNHEADGIEVKSLSGDSDAVSVHVCKEAGMPVERVIRGEELEHISEAALLHLAQNVNVSGLGKKDRRVI